MNRFFDRIIFFRCLAICLICYFSINVFSSIVVIPEVNRHFFFSKDDTSFKESLAIQKMFGVKELVIIAIEGNIHSESYQDRISKLSNELNQHRQIISLKSLSHGPKDIEDALESELWSRLIVAPDRKSSNIILTVNNISFKDFFNEIDPLINKYKSSDFNIHLSGVPYIINQVSDYLKSDVSIFTILSAILIIIVSIFVFRSLTKCSGMILACLLAASITIWTINSINIQLGVMTANLFCIIMVLCISHMVFISFAARKQKNELSRTELFIKSVKETIIPSSLASLTTGLGFATFCFSDAKPLIEFGYTGLVATFACFFCTFTVFPLFLGKNSQQKKFFKLSFLENYLVKIVFILLLTISFLAIAYSLINFKNLNTDPSLLSYFSKKSDLYQGLNFIDTSGGSSPLMLTLFDLNSARFDTSEIYERYWQLQHHLESIPEIGSVVSLPMLLAEANSYYLSKLMSWRMITNYLESKNNAELTGGFLTKDRKLSLIILRMKENLNEHSRTRTIHKIHAICNDYDFGILHTGGIYSLQENMGGLLKKSLKESYLLIFSIFLIVAMLLTFSLSQSIIIIFCITSASAILFAACLLLKLPLDMITIPAISIIMSLGIDELFHLAYYKRNFSRSLSWIKHTEDYAIPVISSSLLLASGFLTLLFSNFPPTIRFGILLVSGVLISCLMTLIAFPKLCKLLKLK